MKQKTLVATERTTILNLITLFENNVIKLENSMAFNVMKVCRNERRFFSKTFSM